MKTLGNMLGGVWVIGALVVSSSCDDGKPVPVCPTTILTSRLESGSITFAFDDTTAVTHAAIDQNVWSEDLPAQPCGVHLPEIWVYPRGGFQYSASVSCFDDPNDLELTFPWTPGRTDVHGNALDRAVVNLSGSSFGCLYELPSTTFFVASSTGNTEPYPTIVSLDYARTYSWHTEATALTANADSFARCPLLTMTADLQFAETAADAVNWPDASCDGPE